MSFISRGIAVLTAPKTELPRAAAEPATTGGLIGGYAAIMAALPALGAVLAIVIFSMAYIGQILGSTILLIVLMYALRDLGLTILVGIGLAALAPSFGGQKNQINGIKLAVYAATPVWVVGFLVQLLGGYAGGLEWLLILLAFAYAGYIIYLGARPMLGVTEQQAPAVAAIGTIAWLVLYFVVSAIVTRIFVSAMIGSAMRGAGYGI